MKATITFTGGDKLDGHHVCSRCPIFRQEGRRAPDELSVLQNCAARLGLARVRRPDLAAQDVAHVAAAAALDGREQLGASCRPVQRSEHVKLLAGSTSWRRISRPRQPLRRSMALGDGVGTRRWRWGAGSALPSAPPSACVACRGRVRARGHDPVAHPFVLAGSREPTPRWFHSFTKTRA
jgi:hypothetical protein